MGAPQRDLLTLKLTFSCRNGIFDVYLFALSNHTPKEKNMDGFTFYVVTDTHYYESSLGASGKAYDERMKGEQKCFRENGEIVHATFEKLAADREIDTIIIAGDLTQNGEYESHISFLKDLEMLKAAGKRILLISARHDFNDSPKAYIGDTPVTVKGTKRTELREMYNDYGYSEALAVDEISYTYVARLCEGVRLLAINCDGDDKCKGCIDDRLKGWIYEQLKEAKNAGDKVIAMQHYPLIPQQPVFDLVGDARLKDWRSIAAFLADNGVNLIFTGHMHAQSIKRFTSENGNSIIDVQTSSTIGYPAMYRTCTVTGNRIDIKSIDVPEFTMKDGTFVDKEYFKRQFSQMIPNKLGQLLKDGKAEQTGIQKFLLKSARSLTFGKAARLVGIGASEELKKMRITDFAVMIVLPLFGGDPEFGPGTPVYNDLSRIFKRISPILKKVNAKLSKNGNTVDIRELVLTSLYNQDELCDNDCSFDI